MKLSAVLVSYNTREQLVRCIEDVLANGVGEVIVVDNASHDASAEIVAKRFPSVLLVRNDENVGFAKAVNQGLSIVSGTFVALVNPDTRATNPKTLDTLVQYLEAHPHVAAVSPLVTHMRPGGRVLAAGRQPTTWRLITHYTGLSRWSRRHPWLEGHYLLAGVHDRQPIEVEWLSGAFLVLRRVVLNEVGGLSERWFMYAEDLELCQRLRRAGWSLVHLPFPHVEHELGGSSANGSINTMWVRSMAQFARDELCRGPISFALWRLTLATGLFTRAVAFREKGGREQIGLAEARKFTAYARAALRA